VEISRNRGPVAPELSVMAGDIERFVGRVVLASTLALLACSSGEDTQEPEGAPSLTKSERCEKTACELEQDECYADVERCEDACIGGSIDAFAACYEVCRSIDCRACSSDSPCAVSSYDFSITGAANAEIEDACLHAVLRDNRCGESRTDPHCSRAAKLERPEVVTAYRCFATTPCGEDGEACTDTLPPSSFGTLFCRRLDALCPEFACDPSEIESSDALGRWLKTDVQTAALQCVNPNYSDTAACYRAWFGAVLGVEP
jgi:hypothetical protein